MSRREIVSVEFLEANDFILKSFPDGNWWVRYAHEDLFIQVNEARNKADLFDNMWVENNLTTREIEYTIAVFNTKFNSKENDQ